MSIELIDESPTTSQPSSQSSSQQNIDEKLQALEKKYMKNIELVNEKKNLINKFNEELVKLQNEALKSLIDLSNLKENYLVALVKSQSEKLKEMK